MVHSAMVASFRQSDGHENADAVERAHAPIARSHHDLNPYDLISPETQRRPGPAQPFEKARFAEGKGDIILDVAREME
jgi:hypothetical protein